MTIYKCNSCNYIFVGDTWHNDCPKCGTSCWEYNGNVIQYKCNSCNIVFLGDDWHNECPKCGCSCWEYDG